MIQKVKIDITTVESGIIVHQVNCQGRMGSGVAKAIRAKFPSVFATYSRHCAKFSTAESFRLLGTSLLLQTQENPKISVCNIFGQLNTGTDERQTDYCALRDGLYSLQNGDLETPIYIPHLIGCGQGGGDWNIVFKMIEHILGAYNVTLCEFTP